MELESKRKTAMLIMMDGAIVGEIYFESKPHPQPEEAETPFDAQWFFY